MKGSFQKTRLLSGAAVSTLRDPNVVVISVKVFSFRLTARSKGEQSSSIVAKTPSFGFVRED